MKTNRQEFALRLCAAAVQSALVALALGQVARAADDQDVKQLTTPTSSVEAGGSYVSKDSAKFGEYNGERHKGLYGVGNFDLRGGGAYDSNDATRWRLTGTDLGLQTRDIQAEYGEQGRFRLSVGFDQLQRNRSDTYQTPYVGAGNTHLILPGNWLTPLFQTGTTASATGALPNPAISMLGLAATPNSPLVNNAAYICPSAAIAGCSVNSALSNASFALGGTNSAANSVYTRGYLSSAANTQLLNQNLADLNDFHTVNLSTKRSKYDFGAALTFNRQWDASASMRREDKQGLKPLGVVNADGAPATPAGGYAVVGGENAVIFPEVIDHTTDQFNAALNFKGESSFATIAYYGSIFTNHAKSMTIDNPWGVGSGSLTSGASAGSAFSMSALGVSSATITEEPDNTYHQLKLTGGYDFNRTTRLVADLTYARNSQNDPFILDPGIFQTPTGGAGAAAVNNGTYVGADSAAAVLVTKTLDLKLTARPIRNLNLAAAYKYDDRDNQTPVKNYVWYDAGAKNFGAASGTLNGASIPGLPAMPLYSGVNVVANRPYSKRVNQGNLEADYSFLAGQAVKAGVDWQSIDRRCNGTWIDCSFADSSNETTERLEYRFRFRDTLSGRVGADWSQRTVDYNANAWMALVPALQATNIPSLVAAGGGAYSGSVYNFLLANGLTANGLPLPANGTSPFTGSTLLTYQTLFGTGNGSLSQNYYGNHNVTNNWAGLDIYNMANRDRSRVRGTVDWQASETFDLQFGGDYRHENYPDSIYGLKSTNGWSLNFDGDYNAGDDLSLNAFYTYEDQHSKTAGDTASNGTVNAVGVTAAAGGTAYTTANGATGVNTAVAGLCGSDAATGLLPAAGQTAVTQFQIFNNNVKIDKCDNWSTDMRDQTHTVGLGLTKRRLFSPKFGLHADVSYSRSTTSNTMTGGSYNAPSTAAFVAGIPAQVFINATSLPDVVTRTLRLKLVGDYRMTKTSLVRMSYMYANLKVDDYQYSTNLPANTSGTVMPDFEAAPNYTVNVFGVTYVYTF